MRVVASQPAVDLITERGARLYVWLARSRCCGAVTRLAASPTPPDGREFRRSGATDLFELYLPAGLDREPAELHVETRRFPRRIEAYWNGCGWVV
jgi:hypothetical protein